VSKHEVPLCGHELRKIEDGVPYISFCWLEVDHDGPHIPSAVWFAVTFTPLRITSVTRRAP